MFKELPKFYPILDSEMQSLCEGINLSPPHHL